MPIIFNYQGRPLTRALRVTVGPVGGTSEDWVSFDLNPSQMDDDYRSQYAQVPIALQDWGPYADGSLPSPVEWVMNDPKRRTIQALLYAPDQTSLHRDDQARRSDDVELILFKLVSFTRKWRTTNEPPVLLWSEGSRVDRVRIEQLHINPLSWTPDLRRRHVKLTFQLIVVNPGVF